MLWRLGLGEKRIAFERELKRREESKKSKLMVAIAIEQQALIERVLLVLSRLDRIDACDLYGNSNVSRGNFKPLNSNVLVGRSSGGNQASIGIRSNCCNVE